MDSSPEKLIEDNYLEALRQYNVSDLNRFPLRYAILEGSVFLYSSRYKGIKSNRYEPVFSWILDFGFSYRLSNMREYLYFAIKTGWDWSRELQSMGASDLYDYSLARLRLMVYTEKEGGKGLVVVLRDSASNTLGRITMKSYIPDYLRGNQ